MVSWPGKVFGITSAFVWKIHHIFATITSYIKAMGLSSGPDKSLRMYLTGAWEMMKVVNKSFLIGRCYGGCFLVWDD